MITKEEGKKKLPEVINRFKRWKEEGRLLKNEDDVKTLIEELFENVLGWDKDDIYRERHPGPTSKRADFQFKDKGIIKLILETKALDVQWTGNVKKQAIGYGWSANKEYVVLTNFQSLILFNAKWKDEDKRIFEIENIEDCEKLSDKFDRLWLLSKESLLNGAIDRFSEDIGKKYKKVEISTIDKQLLSDLKKWRENLTRDIKNLNKLSEEKIDDVVQKIINRLIFIRVCEDRGLSPTITDMISYLRLWQEKRAKPLLEHLLFIFHYYDDIYDGTIFQKNDLCEKVEIHNNVLEKIIEQLYTAEGLGVEYNFAFIDADILGSVYEEYLGYLMKGKKITEDHIHRKEQGIYYTPTYVVDYIVRNILGEVLKQSKEIDKIKILDPACGSGSFLIKAFDVISEFYKEKIGEEKFNREIKNSILINNLYGVDLDPKAVEIAQLNLFLKIGEKGELPKLKENIKCGNSLIGDPKISNRAFKWKEEFEEIMKGGGFDIIIGNPPYGAQLSNSEKDYLSEKYPLNQGRLDTSLLFIEKSLEILKEDGYLGFIVPVRWLVGTYAKRLREFILNNLYIKNIVYFPAQVFEEAAIDTIIFIVKKTKAIDKTKVIFVHKLPFEDIDERMFSQKLWNKDNFEFHIFLDDNSRALINKIEKATHVLEDCCDGFLGIQAYEKESDREKLGNFISKKKLSGFEPELSGEHINRYSLKWNNDLFIKYSDKLYSAKDSSFFKQTKIVVRRILKNRIIATIDENGYYSSDMVYNLIPKNKTDLRVILGLLNSELLSFYYNKKNYDLSATFPKLRVSAFQKLPIPKIISTDERILVELVEKILSLNKKMNDLSIDDEKLRIDKEIKKVEKEIDNIIYKVFNISENERKIIEVSLSD